MMKLINHELIHFFVTFLIAVFVFWKWKNWKLLIWVFGVGIFLDLDHLVDWLLAGGNFSNIRNIITGYYFTTSQKAYVPLHSWELLIPWWAYIIWTARQGSKNNYSLGWAITLAFIGHLLVDQFSYSTQPLTYFFSYRVINEFQLNTLFPHE